MFSKSYWEANCLWTLCFIPKRWIFVSVLNLIHTWTILWISWNPTFFFLLLTCLCYWDFGLFMGLILCLICFHVSWGFNFLVSNRRCSVNAFRLNWCFSLMGWESKEEISVNVLHEQWWTLKSLQFHLKENKQAFFSYASPLFPILVLCNSYIIQ